MACLPGYAGAVNPWRTRRPCGPNCAPRSRLHLAAAHRPRTRRTPRRRALWGRASADDLVSGLDPRPRGLGGPVRAATARSNPCSSPYPAGVRTRRPTGARLRPALTTPTPATEPARTCDAEPRRLEPGTWLSASTPRQNASTWALEIRPAPGRADGPPRAVPRLGVRDAVRARRGGVARSSSPARTRPRRGDPAGAVERVVPGERRELALERRASVSTSLGGREVCRLRTCSSGARSTIQRLPRSASWRGK
ncbi:hypothetical protein SVIOM74S_04558 [Streptomyces violarus]